MATNGHAFPNGKKFAFTVFDDTDASTLESVAPVYQLLSELKMPTTKSVWVFPTDPKLKHAGATIQERDYLRFVLDLQRRGFEIALHNVQNGDAPRKTTERGFEEYRDRLGSYPRTHANHMDNRENLYWGSQRLSQLPAKAAYSVGTRFRYLGHFKGHDPESNFFWGDICKERIQYVRNFVFDETNLDRVNPSQPYHDPAKPYVNYWFSSTNGADVAQFCKSISEDKQDQLEAEHGVCIMYTHFASGFCVNGRVNATFQRLLTRLAQKDGWFVPVSTLLDHLLKNRQSTGISATELHGMERRWVSEKARSARWMSENSNHHRTAIGAVENADR